MKYMTGKPKVSNENDSAGLKPPESFKDQGKILINLLNPQFARLVALSKKRKSDYITNTVITLTVFLWGFFPLLIYTTNRLLN